MKISPALVIIPAAFLALASCAEGYGYGPSYGGGAYYDNGYYDNHYGAIFGGYWGADQVYYYQSQRGQPYLRDDGAHFRRQTFNGARQFRTRDWDHGHHDGDRRTEGDHRGDEQRRGY